MECSYNSLENGLLSCSFEDTNGIKKEARNISFLFVEPGARYRSSVFYRDIADPDKKSPSLKHEFETPVQCRVTGTERSPHRMNRTE